jgi:hypothetical protein
MDRIKTQTKQLHKQENEIGTLKQGFQEFKEHAKKMAEHEYKEKLAQLKTVKKQALEDNDHDLVVEADDKIADLKEEQKQTVEAPTTPSEGELAPEIVAWLPNNDWYNSDIAKRGAADAFAASIREQNPEMPLAEVLENVSKKVAESFNTGARRGANNPMTGTAQAGRPAKRAYGKADLNDEQRKIGERLVKAGALKNIKEYAAQLAEIGEIQR